jgi:hypothetical protein
MDMIIKKTVSDHVLQHMLEHGLELSLETWVDLNWLCEKNVSDLTEEDLLDAPQELVFAYKQGTIARIQ